MIADLANAMRAAATEAIEDEAMSRIGRDLGTVHRDAIVAAGLAAALRVLATAMPAYHHVADLAAALMAVPFEEARTDDRLD